MTRARALDREDLDVSGQATFDRIVESRGRVMGPFLPLMHSPDVAIRVADLGAYLRFTSPLPQSVRALAGLTVARELECEYEFAGVAGTARRIGLDDGFIEALRWPDSRLDDPEMQMIVNFGRELLRRHRVSDRTFAAATERFGEGGTAELVTVFGYYMLIAAVLNAYEIPPNSDEETKLPQETLVDGTGSTPPRQLLK